MQLWAFLISILLPVLAMAQAAPAGSLFASEEPLQITLKYDITKLQAKKDALREEGLPGTLQIDNTKLDVTVMARGKGSFRCKQPQLKIGFNKATTSGTAFDGYKKIKLFTQGRCLENKTDEETDKKILANYLIYKLYEQVFPRHFKTRLVQVSYTDISGKVKPYKQLAFFMEPEKNVEARLQIKKLEDDDLRILDQQLPALTDADDVSLMNAFQFFIGNFDYGIPGFYSHIQRGIFPVEKNVQLYQDGKGVLRPIAYDWDFSRLNYAGSNCGISIRFFADGAMNADCSVEELKFTYADDFVAFHYQDDVYMHVRSLMESFKKWRAANKANIETLGSMYSEQLDAFEQAFPPAILEK